MIAEKYKLIRSVLGYRGCRDHTSKGSLFRPLEATHHAGMDLTESYAMMPAAVVADIYLAHPDTHFSPVGSIADDQLLDWSKHAELPLADADAGWHSGCITAHHGSPT